MLESIIGILGFFIAVAIVILLVKYIPSYESTDQRLENIKDRIDKITKESEENTKKLIELTERLIKSTDTLKNITDKHTRRFNMKNGILNIIASFPDDVSPITFMNLELSASNADLPVPKTITITMDLSHLTGVVLGDLKTDNTSQRFENAAYNSYTEQA